MLLTSRFVQQFLKTSADTPIAKHLQFGESPLLLRDVILCGVTNEQLPDCLRAVDCTYRASVVMNCLGVLSNLSSNETLLAYLDNPERIREDQRTDSQVEEISEHQPSMRHSGVTRRRTNTR